MMGMGKPETPRERQARRRAVPLAVGPSCGLRRMRRGVGRRRCCGELGVWEAAAIPLPPAWRRLAKGGPT